MRRYPPVQTGSHTGWSPGRDRAAQKRFRDALLKRSGGQCEWPGCRTPFFDLQAHHDRAGYAPECGRLLCLRHHRKADPHARSTGKRKAKA